jgi:hypothetical protein
MDAPALDDPRQTQSLHPLADGPVAQDQPPKVDAGDSGATVGTPGSLDTGAVTADLEARFAKEADLGYRGYNPDPNPNESYTVAGVTGQNTSPPAAAPSEPSQETPQEPASPSEG